MKRFRLFPLLGLLIVLAAGMFFVGVRHVQDARAVMAGSCPIYGPEGRTHGLTKTSTQTYVDELFDTSASSAKDVWAVGDYLNAQGTLTYPLVEHWNGSQWRIVPTPTSTTGGFYSVKALNAKDVWATGWAPPGPNSAAGLVEHWDGSTWSVMQTPAVGVASGFSSLAVVSPKDVWVVGSSSATGIGLSRALIEHWNGATWSSMTLPASTVSLGSITALSANDIWAVGCGASSKTNNSTTLVVHWDGSTWSVVPSPSLAYASYLFSVTAISANDIWAAGGYEIISQNGMYGFERMVEHWDGSRWSIIPSPPGPGTRANGLSEVSAVSPNAVWAVGNALATNDSGHFPQGLSEHWNGQNWSVVATAHRGPFTKVDDYLGGITAIVDNDVWVAGFYDAGSLRYTLIEHWDGTKWSIVPSPNK